MGLRKTVDKDRKVYGNCQVQSPDGTLMFRCGERKTNWYLKKGLADIISDDPMVIRLNFEPKGKGYHNSEWGLVKMENKCVNCGSDEFLTRHHVIPYCYRKYFPIELKSHNFHDVLVMCPECHESYERKADIVKKELGDMYDAPISGITDFDKTASKMKRIAHCLLYQEKVPKERIEEMKNILRENFGWERITNRRLVYLSNQLITKNIKNHGEIVCENIDDYQEFVEMWRKHFLENNSCGHLPKNWSITYKK